MKALPAILALALLSLAAVPAQAAPATSSNSGSSLACNVFSTTAVAAVVAAGEIDVCIKAPDTVPTASTVFHVQASAITPGTVAGTTTFTWTISATGCTIGTEVKVSTSTAALAAGSDYFPVTMTSNECRGNAHVVISSGATPTTLLTWDITWNTMYRPDEITSGGLTVTNAGGQTMTVSSWPALNAVLSGSVGVDILDDTTDDGMLTVPVPTDTSFNSTFGNVTFQQATAREKATAGYNAWAPLLLAMGVLAASVLGARGINYTGVGFAGIMFMFAGIVAWKSAGSWALGMMLIGFGLYLTILAGGELKSWRASKAQEAEALAAEASPE